MRRGSGVTASRAFKRHPGIKRFGIDLTNEALSRIADQIIQKIETHVTRKTTPKKAKKQYLHLLDRRTRRLTPSIIRRMRRR